MRSSHSLAFQQFEETVSHLKIERISPADMEIISLLKSNGYKDCKDLLFPVKMRWEISSDYEKGNDQDEVCGTCYLIPIPISLHSGEMIRSEGYTEKTKVISKYHFTSDGTFLLDTKYDQAISEERIWFLSRNVRCRSSVIKTSEGAGILQTSFASEVRLN
ncbi:phycobiliprotein lyase [Prochlorococcus sp. MIT 1341]|uniref:phycobiliprotein lyase n=1 Tax=Prochlorococcus sp. MIT 1341 TaxID=3096221 RepID=UPI002A74C0D9|nr:phycobiliprotein lyase [Prochlorococcus sp. MIT 1341]